MHTIQLLQSLAGTQEFTFRFAVQPEHFNFAVCKDNSVTAILQIANVVT